MLPEESFEDVFYKFMSSMEDYNLIDLGDYYYIRGGLEAVLSYDIVDEVIEFLKKMKEEKGDK